MSIYLAKPLFSSDYFSIIPHTKTGELRITSSDLIRIHFAIFVSLPSPLLSAMTCLSSWYHSTYIEGSSSNMNCYERSKLFTQTTLKKRIKCPMLTWEMSFSQCFFRILRSFQAFQNRISGDFPTLDQSKTRTKSPSHFPGLHFFSLYSSLSGQGFGFKFISNPHL